VLTKASDGVGVECRGVRARSGWTGRAGAPMGAIIRWALDACLTPREQAARKGGARW